MSYETWESQTTGTGDATIIVIQDSSTYSQTQEAVSDGQEVSDSSGS
jgi:hypothetical protein